MTTNFSSETMEPRGNSAIFFKHWEKKRNTKSESYTQRKYPSGNKGKSGHSQTRENQENLFQADIQRTAKESSLKKKISKRRKFGTSAREKEHSKQNYG